MYINLDYENDEELEAAARTLEIMSVSALKRGWYLIEPEDMGLDNVVAQK